MEIFKKIKWTKKSKGQGLGRKKILKEQDRESMKRERKDKDKKRRLESDKDCVVSATKRSQAGGYLKFI